MPSKPKAKVRKTSLLTLVLLMLLGCHTSPPNRVIIHCWKHEDGHLRNLRIEDKPLKAGSVVFFRREDCDNVQVFLVQPQCRY